MIDILLFDLDGTLVDSIPDLANALNTMLCTLELPIVTTDTIRNIVGKGFPTTVRKILELNTLSKKDIEALHPKALSLTLENYALKHGQNTHIYPHVIDTLKELAPKYKMAVVTNKEEAHARALLETLKLSQYFQCIIGGDTTSHYKPHAMPLIEAIKRLGTHHTHSIMIGDSETDISAARNANVPIIAVTYGYNHGNDIADHTPDYIIHEFKQLTQLLRDIS